MSFIYFVILLAVYSQLFSAVQESKVYKNLLLVFVLGLVSYHLYDFYSDGGYLLRSITEVPIQLVCTTLVALIILHLVYYGFQRNQQQALAFEMNLQNVVIFTVILPILISFVRVFIVRESTPSSALFT